MNLRSELEKLNSSSTIIVVGRGHSGTRLIAQLLHQNGVFMGDVNDSYDLVPADHMYDAAKEFGSKCTQVAPFVWHITTSKPTDSYIDNLYNYLRSLIDHDGMVGWKLPETIFSLPWIIKLLPDAKYIYWHRDPMQIISRWHISDNLNSWGVKCDAIDPVEMRAASILYQLRMMKSFKPEHYFDMQYDFFINNHKCAVEWISGFIGKKLYPLDNIDMNRAQRTNACSILVDEFMGL